MGLLMVNFEDINYANLKARAEYQDLQNELRLKYFS
jgi:hypothetical protein